MAKDRQAVKARRILPVTFVTPRQSDAEVTESENVVKLDAERERRADAADLKEAKRAPTDAIDPSFKNRRLYEGPLSCAECTFYKKAGGFSKPCKDIGCEEDAQACNRFLVDISRWPKEIREPAIKLIEQANAFGVKANHLVALSHSSDNLKKRTFGERVMIPVPTPGKFEAGIVVGERAGKLHILNNKGMVAVISDTGLLAPSDVPAQDLTVTVKIKEIPTVLKQIGSTMVVKRPGNRQSQQGVVVLRGGGKAEPKDEIAEVKPANKTKAVAPKLVAPKVAPSKSKASAPDAPKAKTAKPVTVVKPAGKVKVAAKMTSRRPVVEDDEEVTVTIIKKRR